MDKVKTHDDFKSKYQENQDTHTRRIALEKIVAEVMNRERKKELELYKLFAGDEAFRVGMLDASKLSPIIDISAQRFNIELELKDEEKADYKIKAKQFVKIYGQMSSIMPYEIVAWEKLFWFLKFLIPKMIIKDKDQDKLDELLNSVDLSTYGLERVKLGISIGLDESATQLDPQNANPRGAHGDNEKDLLDSIINAFNEKWFHGWEATPEEQRVKFINLMDKVKTHDDFKSKYKENQDSHTRRLALEKIVAEVMNKERKKELDLYKLFAGDEAFRVGMLDSFERALSSPSM